MFEDIAKGRACRYESECTETGTIQALAMLAFFTPSGIKTNVRRYVFIVEITCNLGTVLTGGERRAR